MWLERFVIVVTSLHRDFLPHRGGCTTRTIGMDDLHRTIGVRDAFFLFIRFLPMISILRCGEGARAKLPTTEGH